MVKRTVILKPSGASGASSDDKNKVARPDISAIAAEEELKADEKKNAEADVPEPGQKPDNRKRCEHGRLFKCQQCEGMKGKLTPEQLERRRERLEDMSIQFHVSLFNLVGLIAGDEEFRLTQEEKHGLGKTGATAIEEVAPETSIKAVAIIGYAVTLAGCVTGKIFDAQRKAAQKKDAGVHNVLDTKGKNGKEHSQADHGDEAERKDVSSPPLLRIP
jgi:hypothetical protein